MPSITDANNFKTKLPRRAAVSLLGRHQDECIDPNARAAKPGGGLWGNEFSQPKQELKEYFPVFSSSECLLERVFHSRC